jgi:hypothetical protein
VFCIQRREGVKKKNNHPIILKIPDRLWDEIKNILPKGETTQDSWWSDNHTIQKSDRWNSLCIKNREDVNGRCYLKNTDLVLLVIAGFRNGIALIYSKRDGSDY